jgi:hypothetical protein
MLEFLGFLDILGEDLEFLDMLGFLGFFEFLDILGFLEFVSFVVCYGFLVRGRGSGFWIQSSSRVRKIRNLDIPQGL